MIQRILNIIKFCCLLMMISLSLSTAEENEVPSTEPDPAHGEQQSKAYTENDRITVAHPSSRIPLATNMKYDHHVESHVKSTDIRPSILTADSAAASFGSSTPSVPAEVNNHRLKSVA